MSRKKLWKSFDDYMTAATFAEAGEAATARSFVARRRTVLLVLTPRSADTRSTAYAHSVCQRIEADLEILFVPGGPEQEKFLREYREQLEKDRIPVRLIEASGCLKQAVLDYTRRRRDIHFVVVESAEELNISCDENKGRVKGFLARLRCPLVVVSEAPGLA